MKLKELRLKSGLTQTELAKDLNLSKNQILRYENRTSEVPTNILIDIANYFNVSLDFLCERPFNTNNIGYIDAKRKETLQKINELSDENFACVQAYLTGILISEAQKQNALQKFNQN